MILQIYSTVLYIILWYGCCNIKSTIILKQTYAGLFCSYTIIRETKSYNQNQLEQLLVGDFVLIWKEEGEIAFYWKIYFANGSYDMLKQSILQFFTQEIGTTQNFSATYS